MFMLPNTISRFNEIPIQVIIYHRNIKIFIWKPKRHVIIKSTWNKQNIDRDITIPDFKLYYESIVTKQQNTVTKERILYNSHKYSHLTFTELLKAKHQKGDELSNGIWENVELGPYLPPYKINSKWIKPLLKELKLAEL